VAAALAGALWQAIFGPADAAQTGRITIDAAAGPIARFNPRQAFGAAIDGMGRGEVARLFTPFNIARMNEAGLGPITYRLRTELGIEAWHWSEEGAWSDPVRKQGYWVSSDHPAAPVLTSWGYALPRRGDTIDQANNNGYSRLDDGDPATFWKSNPYLDPRYTGAAEARPQWVVVEFDRARPVDAARIDWATPYARRYRVQYWVGVDEYDDEGRWVTFPGGAVTTGLGGQERLKLSARPIRTRFVRLLLEASSNTAPAGSNDPRDAIGYAIGEVALGVTGPAGELVDAVRHAPNRVGQTLMHVSSTDPWHQAVDRDADLEQPGFDLVYGGGVTRGAPMMVPVGAYYDTPENAAAEIRFLEARHYPIGKVELGEEPDGQYIDAEDFGALYLEFADALHRVDPRLSLGGPSLEQAIADLWLDPSPDRSWTSHFIGYLRSRGRLADLNFFTFEHYPFDDLCGDLNDKLMAETGLMDAALARFRADGVPTNIPWLISEYGFSAFGGQGEVEPQSALLNADIVAQFMAGGGAGAYLFGYGPDGAYRGAKPCAGAGNLMLWQADDDGQARSPMPTFWGARMLALDWAGEGDGPDSLYATASDVRDPAGRPLVVAYALKRPDGTWAVLLLNRDGHAVHKVRLDIRRADGAEPRPLAGPLDLVQWGAAQYVWRADGAGGAPIRDLPPRRFREPGPATAIALPANSITVVRAPA
jgi:hypothetical protein